MEFIQNELLTFVSSGWMVNRTQKTSSVWGSGGPDHHCAGLISSHGLKHRPLQVGLLHVGPTLTRTSQRCPPHPQSLGNVEGRFPRLEHITNAETLREITAGNVSHNYSLAGDHVQSCTRLVGGGSTKARQKQYYHANER